MSRGLRLAALAAVLYFAGVAVWLRYDRRSAREAFDAGSTFNTGEDGASQALGYLRERGTRASTLHGRIDSGLPARGVVFRLQPTLGPLLIPEDDEEGEEEEKDEKDQSEEQEDEPRPARLLTGAEEDWVRGGGRLVLALGKGSYGPARAEEIQGRQPVHKVFPLWPGVTRLVPETPRRLVLEPPATGHAVFLAGQEPMVLRQVLGDGEVVLLATPEILHNAHLGKADHLALLEALAGVPEGRPVLFDERSHGLSDTDGVLETLAGWGLGPFLLLVLLAAGAAFWRASPRLGPAERPGRDTRSDAVELLDSLADLYDRALGRSDAVRLYHESFMHTVAVETGLRGPALEARTKALLDGFVPPPATAGADIPRETFERALRTINQAFRRLQDAKRK